MSLLEIKDWHLAFQGESQDLKVLNGINIKIDKGQTVGLVGESGSGKSVMGLSIMGLLPNTARVQRGEILFNGKPFQANKMRGSEISMIFQDPISSLNPAFRVEDQISETLKLHQKLSGQPLRDRCRELLQLVGIPDPQARLRAYPHELSGGMAQRIMIAIAVACDPKLLIADEPTTALDVTIQAQILDLLKTLQKKTGLSILLISHDMGVISQNSQQVNVMYCGEIIETGETQKVIHTPRHPYTAALLNCLPAKYVFQKDAGIDHLPAIPGTVPSLRDRPTGCVFRTRCPKAQPKCLEKPPYFDFGGQKAACFFPMEGPLP